LGVDINWKDTVCTLERYMKHAWIYYKRFLDCSYNFLICYTAELLWIVGIDEYTYSGHSITDGTRKMVRIKMFE